MCRQHEHNIYKVNFDYDFILLPEANYFHSKSYCGTIQTKDIAAAYKGLASMLAGVHILIFCNAINYSSGRSFSAQLLCISSSMVFNWANVVG